MSSLVNTDFLDPRAPSFRADPYPILAHFREHNPVHWSPALKAWVVTRYNDVRAVLLDDQLSSDTVTPFYRAQTSETQTKIETLVRYLGNWLVFKDRPDHARLRRLVSRVFTTNALQTIKPNIAAIVAQLLDDLDDRDEIDLVQAFSNPLPAFVIMDMLGIPRSRLHDVKTWSDEIKLFIGAAQHTPDKYDRAREGALAMAAMFQELIDQQRREPTDNVLAMLVSARDEDDDRLSDDELIATSILFLFAGHETTTNLISMASLHLLHHPEQRRAFIALETAEEVAIAVEEFLRFDGPTPSMVRLANRPHQLAGAEIKEGQRVYAMIASANHDPAVFDRPDQLDVRRNPNRHVTFGYGAHFCLGAPLARMEANLALPALHRKFPDMVLNGEAAWADGLTLRGPTALPVRLCPR